MPKPYDPRIEQYLEEIARTPTGWPLVDWVRLHHPRIEWGVPMAGGAFAYPWPFARIVIGDEGSEQWQREAIAHELVHLMRWRGHLVASLEQEYDAYLTSAKVRCEHNGWDWTTPDPEAVAAYPLFFGPRADKDEFKRQLRQRLPLYAILPWEQPYDLPGIAVAMIRQSLFGARTMIGKVVGKRLPKQQP